MAISSSRGYSFTSRFAASGSVGDQTLAADTLHSVTDQPDPLRGSRVHRRAGSQSSTNV